MEYDLNNYPNDYPNGVNNSEQQKQPKRGGGFLGGFFCGLLSCLLVVSCTYVAVQFHGLWEMTREKEVTQQTEGEEELVSDQTMAKLQVIEETISEYYYEEDVEEQDMIDGMYAGVVAALGDPYSTYYTEEDIDVANSTINLNLYYNSHSKNPNAQGHSVISFKLPEDVVHTHQFPEDSIKLVLNAIKGYEESEFTKVGECMVAVKDFSEPRY